ncbi:MAG: transcription termination/antitermination NusG family protein [bacterium]
MDAQIIEGYVSAGEPLWHVLYVKPRCEKKMAGYCDAHGVEWDLPVREETKIYQRRKVTVHKPVFPGYVFLRFSPEQKLTVLKSNLVVRILPIDNQERFYNELQQIRQALVIDPTLDASAAFQAGRRVLIKSGPFQGVEGIVQLVKGKTKVVLNVDIIGRAIAVEVGLELLEPVE